MPKTFIIRDVGVTTAKKTTPITIGDIKFPNRIPNLNQILFKGLKIFEFNRPKIKKITETINDHILKSSPLIKGKIAIIKKTIKKTIPKLLFELILMLSIFKKIKLMKVVFSYLLF